MKIQQPEEAERIIRVNGTRLETSLANLENLTAALKRVGLEKAAMEISVEIGTIRHSSKLMTDELFGSKE